MDKIKEVPFVINSTAASEFSTGRSTAVDYNLSGTMKRGAPDILNTYTITSPAEKNDNKYEPFFGQNIKEAVEVVRGIFKK